MTTNSWVTVNGRRYRKCIYQAYRPNNGYEANVIGWAGFVESARTLNCLPWHGTREAVEAAAAAYLHDQRATS